MKNKIILICEKCFSRNYSTKKNNNSTERLVLMKFCKKCNLHTKHLESR